VANSTEGGPELLDRAERPDPQEVLFQCPDETLGDAIAFGFTDKSGGGFDAEASDFGLKVLGHVIGPVIVTQPQSAGDIRGDGAEAAVYPLPNRLQRLETIGRSCGRDANDLRVGMFDGDEHIGLGRNHLRYVRSPHFVDTISDDRALMRLG
jgi:hypothetical protein